MSAAAVKPVAGQLLGWRYIRHDDAIVLVTAAGAQIVPVEHDEGTIWFGDAIDADLAEELLADVLRHDANIHGAPAHSKYDASIKVPPCPECNDEGFVEDEDFSGRSQRYACSSCDPDGSGLEDVRERFEAREEARWDRLADEAAERLQIVGRL